MKKIGPLSIYGPLSPYGATIIDDTLNVAALIDDAIKESKHKPRPREPVPVPARLCRAGCGKTFMLSVPTSPDAVSQQVCNNCMDIFIQAMAAAWSKSARPKPPEGRDRIASIETVHLLQQLRAHRAEFEAAWRLGASDDELRQILTGRS